MEKSTKAGVRHCQVLQEPYKIIGTVHHSVLHLSMVVILISDDQISQKEKHTNSLQVNEDVKRNEGLA